MARLVGRGTSFLVWVLGFVVSFLFGALERPLSAQTKYGGPRPPAGGGWFADPEPTPRPPVDDDFVAAKYGMPIPKYGMALPPEPLRPRPRPEPQATPTPTPADATSELRRQVRQVVEEAAGTPLTQAWLARHRARLEALGPAAGAELTRLLDELTARDVQLRAQAKALKAEGGSPRHLAQVREQLRQTVARRKAARGLQSTATSAGAGAPTSAPALDVSPRELKPRD